MGIDLHSGNCFFGCSYSSWNHLRYIIIKATLKYLGELIDNYVKNDAENDPKNDVESNYQCYLDDIKNFLYKIEQVRMCYSNNEEGKLLHIFISIITSDMSYLDKLIRFDLGGLFSLCYKSDCDGFYSAGNSLDICKLLDTIKPFVRTIDDHTYNAIYTKDERHHNILYEVFEDSWKNNNVIVIC